MQSLSDWNIKAMESVVSCPPGDASMARWKVLPYLLYICYLISLSKNSCQRGNYYFGLLKHRILVVIFYLFIFIFLVIVLLTENFIQCTVEHVHLSILIPSHPSLRLLLPISH